MINIELLLWLLVPISLTGASIFVLSYLNWLLIDAFKVAGISVAIGVLFVVGAFFIGKGSQTSDTEILNGQVISKKREHGSYVHTYSCNCVTSCSGSGNSQSCSTVCQTCYEDHYTVHWDCFSDVGEFRIADLDRTSKSVYNEPDPARYTIIKPGDPVAKEHTYTNYIKAVPATLFRPASKSLLARYGGKVPAYPDKVYDFYKINRVLPIGVNVPDLAIWNQRLSESLKTLGPMKQANAVIVLTNIADPDFFYAVQDAWLGGKKNDIVLVIGVTNLPAKASWVRVMALTQDELFQVKLRDSILGLEEIKASGVIAALDKETRANFKRKRMRDFAYLDAEIGPPFWVMALTSGMLIFGHGVFWFSMWRNERVQTKW